MITKILVAMDPRINPAAGLLFRTLDDLGRQFCGLCESVVSTCESARSSSVSYNKNSSSYQRSSSPKIPPMPHCKVPDYGACISAGIVKLRRKYETLEKAVNERRSEIESHERIDVEQLSVEINELKCDMDKCQSEEDEFVRQRRVYRTEGALRNLLVHGIAQYSLLRQIRKLQKKKALLSARKEALAAAIAKRKHFDFTEKKSLLRKQEEELTTTWEDHAREVARLDDFVRRMKSFVDRVADAARRLNDEIDKYNALNSFAAQLDTASNSYERFCIHQKCEREFGDGSVGRLRSRALSRIRTLTVNYEKQVRQAEKRARSLQHYGRKSRDIKAHAGYLHQSHMEI